VADYSNKLKMSTSTGTESSRKRGGDRDIRKRNTRACDNCRKTKSKCDRDDEDGPCDPCTFQGVECRFSTPTKQRGPKKGYLQVLESRCHAAEAVLGILLSLPDRRATSLLSELSEDLFVQSVLDQVNRSAFGPQGRPTSPGLDLELNSSAGTSRDTLTYADPFTHGPTNGWQDAIIDRFRANDEEGRMESFGMQSTLSTPSTLTDDENHGQNTTLTDGEMDQGRKKTRRD